MCLGEQSEKFTMRISVASALVLLVLFLTQTVSSDRLEKTKGKPATTTSPSILDRAASDDGGNSIEPEQLMRECSSTNDCAPSYCCTVGKLNKKNSHHPNKLTLLM